MLFHLQSVRMLVNAMFDDIDSSINFYQFVHKLLNCWLADLRDQSEYLFGATDELNEKLCRFVILQIWQQD